MSHAPVAPVKLPGGAVLDGATRSALEPRFGRSFDDVRIHVGTRAHDLASGTGARAYTFGRHIVFADGEYAPQTSAGRRLIAHELAHVAQQDVAGASEASVSHVEMDASHAADRALRGSPAIVRARASAAVPLLQRAEEVDDAVRKGRGLTRALNPPLGPPRYRNWSRDYDRLFGEDGPAPKHWDVATTESIVQQCVQTLRPDTPAWWDTENMAKFDCSNLYGRPGRFDFRGRVMAGWEVNYYFVSLAMAHQGWDWTEAQAIIIAWNAMQGAGVNPWYEGGGDMTDEMWFAAHEGFTDELQRMALGR